MKVLAINASPKRAEGTTELILQPFIKGLRSEGADVELKYIYGMNITPCNGCTNDILFEPEQECLIEDDMKELYHKLNDADLWLFASPNYLNSVTSGLKNLFDRLEPLFEAPHIFENNQCYDKIKQSLTKRTSQGSVLLITTCGHWGMDNFKSIIEQVEYVADMMGRKFLPPIVRPHSSVLKSLSNLGKSPTDVYIAAEQAGIELVRTGTISQENINIISRELVPRDSFIQELSLLVQ